MKLRTLLATLALAVGSPVFAGVKLPSIFGSHMVLQRDIALPVWGWADPGEEITVKIADQSKSTKADEAGKWKLKLDPIQSDGTLAMTVSGKNTITLEDVLIGDVWLCSGQSNMQWSIKQSKDAEKEIAAADYPQLRLFHVKRTPSDTKLDDVEGAWRVCRPDQIAEFSAVAYHFGRELNQEIKVPIGLVHSSWGGTVAEAWTDASLLEQSEILSPILDRAAKLPPATQPSDLRNRPGRLYNAMIHPLVPFGIKGVIWYQGESNAPRAMQYRTLLPTMIGNWRNVWGQGDFPFFIVQLANYKTDWTDPNARNDWAELREAQTLTTRNVPNCWQAIIIDAGDAKDIHPKDKQTVGHRLALLARKHVYGQDIPADSPSFKSMKVEGNKAILTFDNAGGGFKASGDELGSFAIAGEDRLFRWAKAKITGKDTVEVWADDVATPVAVRYCWGGNPIATLFSSEGLPADPFRTDDWPGQTDNAR